MEEATQFPQEHHNHDIWLLESNNDRWTKKNPNKIYIVQRKS